MSLVLFFLISLVYYCNTLCNFAEFQLLVKDVLGYESVGTFSVSTNRCQSIYALLDFRGIINQEIKGSIQFTCLSNSNELLFTRYSDHFCSDAYIVDQSTISVNSEYYLVNSIIKMKIKKMECGDYNCMVSSAFGEDCTFAESKYYFNISVPPNQCETLKAKVVYQAVITTLEEQVLPEEFVVPLEESSIQFACCNDNSLMIYNHSDARCRYQTNSYRISSKYNNKCLNIGDWTRRRTLFDEYIYNQRRLQNAFEASALVLSWECDSLITCTEPFETDLPPLCDNTCTSWAWNPVTTAVPDTSSFGNKDTRIVIISIILLVLFIVLIVIVYGYLRYKSMSKQVSKQQPKPKRQNISINNDSKYKPMIENSIEKNANIIVPQSISNLDNNNNNNNNMNQQPISYENQNYITVATLNNDGI